MIHRKVVPFDEFYYQLKLMHLFLLHPVYFFQKNLLIILATICRQKSPKTCIYDLFISKNKNEECACNVKPFFVQKIYQVSARNVPIRKSGDSLDVFFFSGKIKAVMNTLNVKNSQSKLVLWHIFFQENC
jgi:hypothetical protein